MLYSTLRPLFFSLDPEHAHRLALEAARLASGLPGRRIAGTPVELMGLRFPNRVGLAAGFDKSAEAVDGLGRLGFGFIEIGHRDSESAGRPAPAATVSARERERADQSARVPERRCGRGREAPQGAALPRRARREHRQERGHAARPRARRLRRVPACAARRRRLRHGEHLVTEHGRAARSARARAARAAAARAAARARSRCCPAARAGCRCS